MASQDMRTTQNEQALCRFCLAEKSDSKNPFLTPCECRGSVEFVHLYCLNKWRNKNTERNYTFCSLCNAAYRIPPQYSLEHIPEKNFFFIVLDYPIWINFLTNYVWLIWAGILQSKSPDVIETYVTCQLVFKAYYIFSMVWNFHVIKKQRYRQAWSKEYRILFFPFYGLLTGIAFVSYNPFVWFVPTLYLIMVWHIHLTILREMNEEDMRIQNQVE